MPKRTCDCENLDTCFTCRKRERERRRRLGLDKLPKKLQCTCGDSVGCQVCRHRERERRRLHALPKLEPLPWTPRHVPNVRPIEAGERFGALTVTKSRELGPPAAKTVEVVCDCSEILTARVVSLLTGKRTGCRQGCRVAHSLSHLDRTTHGHAKRGAVAPTFITWQALIGRCTNPHHDAWDNYGGRGITVCDRWRASFASFLSDMGERPEGTSIDRIDNEGPYEPGNCRWATATQQANNRRVRVGSHEQPKGARGRAA